MTYLRYVRAVTQGVSYAYYGDINRRAIGMRVPSAGLVWEIFGRRFPAGGKLHDMARPCGIVHGNTRGVREARDDQADAE